MVEKDNTVKQLQAKKAKYTTRNKRLIALLIFQFLIWWIVNPEFIPILSTWMTAIKQFFGDLLWPQNAAELLTNSYRVYIYRMCQWIQDLALYDFLAWAAPRVLPTLFIINLILIWVTSRRIKRANKPPKIKKPRKKLQWKLPSIQLPTGKKVCGLYSKDKDARMANLKKLQDSCTELRSEHVVWVGNNAKGAGGKAPQDKLYKLDTNKLVQIPLDGGEYRIGLMELNTGARVAFFYVDGQPPIRMTPGVPILVSHKSESGNELRDMTITWIGGSL